MTDTTARDVIAKAGLVDRATQAFAAYRGIGRTIIDEMITAIAAQAREIEQFKAELRVVYKLPFAMDNPIAQKLTAEREAAEARVRELTEEMKSVEISDNHHEEQYAEAIERVEAAEARVRELEREPDQTLENERDALLAECDHERAKREAAEARVRELEQDIKWLKDDPQLVPHQQINLSFLARAEAAEAEIKQLKSIIHPETSSMNWDLENDALRRRCESAEASVAETIERCAKVADDREGGSEGGPGAYLGIAAAIRALGKEPSGPAGDRGQVGWMGGEGP